MRKLILAAAIILVSSSAFAGGTRGLSGPSAQSAEPQRPVRLAEVTILRGPAEQPAVTVPPLTVEEKLKAAGELKPDGTPAVPPVQTQAPAPAPVQAAPVQPAPVQAVSTPAPAQAQPVQQPARKQAAKRRESDEHKARRIAARFGISW